MAAWHDQEDGKQAYRQHHMCQKKPVMTPQFLGHPCEATRCGFSEIVFKH